MEISLFTVYNSLPRTADPPAFRHVDIEPANVFIVGVIGVRFNRAGACEAFFFALQAAGMRDQTQTADAKGRR